MKTLLASLLVLGCVTGCSPPPSPEARGASTPAPKKGQPTTSAPTPDTEPAPPANTACADLDECRARCDAKQAPACSTAAEGLERLGTFSLEEQASLYERGCELGDANACAALGVLVQDGRGRPHDDAKARQIYERACDDGSGVACFNLALMYRSGNGAPIDDAKATALLAKAVPHYQAACDAGELEWCMNLGFVYEHGYAGEPDIERAESIYRDACTAGHANSCVNLSLLWLDQGTSPDTALAQLERACEGESGLACGALGHVYLKPAPAVTRDPARASTLLEKGCQLGDARGCTLLAGMLSLGDDLPTDGERAQTLYERACTLGSSDACFLGSFAFGKDQADAALPFIERACNIGHAEACGQLGAHYQIGVGVEADDARAQALYVESCRMGYPGSCVELLRRKIELPIPEPDRSAFLQQGCQQGVPEACAALRP